jgi:hypothetical protein
MQVEMKYIQHWTDHLGRKRYRLRRRGFKRVELPVDGDPDSVEFQAAYYAALRGEKPSEAVAAVAARGGSGSVKDAIERYLDSTTFNYDYVESTKAMRRSILNSVSRLASTACPGSSASFRSRRWIATGSSAGWRRPRPRASSARACWQ